MLAPCRVSRYWRIAATDVLYRYVAPHSLRSAELLLRTLREDVEGVLVERIKVLHLPMISRTRLWQLVFDGSGIPVLSGHHSDSVYSELNHNDIQHLSRTFASIVPLCRRLEELHAPVLNSLTCLGPPSQLSMLRRLFIAGPGTLSLLSNEIFLADPPILFHLEVLSVYRFSQYHEQLRKLQTKVIDLQGHGKSPLPNLHTLHLQDGRIRISTVFDLLNVFGMTLSTLTLQNLRLLASIGEPATSGMEPSFPNLKTLVTDVNTLRLLCHNPSINPPIFDASLLQNAPVLHTLEVRLLSTETDNRFRFTPPEWLPTNLVEEFPVHWRWMSNIPSTLQVLKMVTCFHGVEQPDSSELVTRQRRATASLRNIICQGRSDLESLQFEILERNPI
jgi:hypothetical protein